MYAIICLQYKYQCYVTYVVYCYEVLLCLILALSCLRYLTLMVYDLNFSDPPWLDNFLGFLANKEVPLASSVPCTSDFGIALSIYFMHVHIFTLFGPYMFMLFSYMLYNDI